MQTMHVQFKLMAGLLLFFGVFFGVTSSGFATDLVATFREFPDNLAQLTQRSGDRQLAQVSGLAQHGTAFDIEQFTGKGVAIVVIDSGVDYTLPVFGSCDTSQILSGTCESIAFSYNAVTKTKDVMDVEGHGTTVAAIIKQIAPDADLFVYSIPMDFEAPGSSPLISASAYIDVLNRIPEDLEGYEHKIINLSIGFRTIDNEEVKKIVLEDLKDFIERQIDHLARQGFVVVQAAGNDGPGAETVFGAGGSEAVITVGAATDSGDIADFSSRGPFCEDLHCIDKPDIVAIGEQLCLQTSTQNIFPYSPSCNPTQTAPFLMMDGTSFAAPQVAGFAALLFEAYPELSINQLRTSFFRGAIDLKNFFAEESYTKNEQGFGMLDPVGAFPKKVILEKSGSGTVITEDVSVSDRVIIDGESVEFFCDTNDTHCEATFLTDSQFILVAQQRDDHVVVWDGCQDVEEGGDRSQCLVDLGDEHETDQEYKSREKRVAVEFMSCADAQQRGRAVQGSGCDEEVDNKMLILRPRFPAFPIEDRMSDAEVISYMEQAKDFFEEASYDQYIFDYEVAPPKEFSQDRFSAYPVTSAGYRGEILREYLCSLQEDSNFDISNFTHIAAIHEVDGEKYTELIFASEEEYSEEELREFRESRTEGYFRAFSKFEPIQPRNIYPSDCADPNSQTREITVAVGDLIFSKNDQSVGYTDLLPHVQLMLHEIAHTLGNVGLGHEFFAAGGEYSSTWSIMGNGQKTLQPSAVAKKYIGWLGEDSTDTLTIRGPGTYTISALESDRNDYPRNAEMHIDGSTFFSGQTLEFRQPIGFDGRRLANIGRTDEAGLLLGRSNIAECSFNQCSLVYSIGEKSETLREGECFVRDNIRISIPENGFQNAGTDFATATFNVDTHSAGSAETACSPNIQIENFQLSSNGAPVVGELVELRYTIVNRGGSSGTFTIKEWVGERSDYSSSAYAYPNANPLTGITEFPGTSATLAPGEEMEHVVGVYQVSKIGQYGLTIQLNTENAAGQSNSRFIDKFFYVEGTPDRQFPPLPGIEYDVVIEPLGIFGERLPASAWNDVFVESASCGGRCDVLRGVLTGTTITLNAVSNSPNYSFVEWGGFIDFCGTNPVCTFTVNEETFPIEPGTYPYLQSIIAQAYFEESKNSALELEIIGNNPDSIRIEEAVIGSEQNPDLPIVCDNSCLIDASPGTTLQLVPLSGVGSGKVSWTGCDSVTPPPLGFIGDRCTVTLGPSSSIRSVQATFVSSVTFGIEMDTRDIASVTLHANNTQGDPEEFVCMESSCSYEVEQGTSTTLIVRTARDGIPIIEHNDCSGQDNAFCTINSVMEDTFVALSFTPAPEIEITIEGEGDVEVSYTLPDDTGGEFLCEEELCYVTTPEGQNLPEGSFVSLISIADEENEFVEWKTETPSLSRCNESSGVCTFFHSEETQVTAEYSTEVMVTIDIDTNDFEEVILQFTDPQENLRQRSCSRSSCSYNILQGSGVTILSTLKTFGSVDIDHPECNQADDSLCNIADITRSITLNPIFVPPGPRLYNLRFDGVGFLNNALIATVITRNGETVLNDERDCKIHNCDLIDRQVRAGDTVGIQFTQVGTGLLYWENIIGIDEDSCTYTLASGNCQFTMPYNEVNIDAHVYTPGRSNNDARGGAVDDANITSSTESEITTLPTQKSIFANIFSVAKNIFGNFSLRRANSGLAQVGGGAGSAADIVARDVSMLPAQPTLADEVFLFGQITNEGDIDITNNYIEVEGMIERREENGTWTLVYSAGQYPDNALDKNTARAITFPLTWFPKLHGEGVYRYTMCAHTLNPITEGNQENNCLSHIFNIADAGDDGLFMVTTGSADGEASSGKVTSQSVFGQQNFEGCTESCALSFFPGTRLVLTPLPNPGYFFAGWTGEHADQCTRYLNEDETGFLDACGIFTDSDKIVKARFIIDEDNPILPYGDVNEDGSVTVSDALATLQYAVRGTAEGTAFNPVLADIDCNGGGGVNPRVTAADALFILKVAVGQESAPQQCPVAGASLGVPDLNIFAQGDGALEVEDIEQTRKGDFKITLKAIPTVNGTKITWTGDSRCRGEKCKITTKGLDKHTLTAVFGDGSTTGDEEDPVSNEGPTPGDSDLLIRSSDDLRLSAGRKNVSFRAKLYNGGAETYEAPLRFTINIDDDISETHELRNGKTQRIGDDRTKNVSIKTNWAPTVGQHTYTFCVLPLTDADTSNNCASGTFEINQRGKLVGSGGMAVALGALGVLITLSAALRIRQRIAEVI